MKEKDRETETERKGQRQRQRETQRDERSGRDQVINLNTNAYMQFPCLSHEPGCNWAELGSGTEGGNASSH